MRRLWATSPKKLLYIRFRRCLLSCDLTADPSCVPSHAAQLCFLVVKRIDLPCGGIAGLIVAVAGGVVLYGGLLLAFEGDFRQLLWGARD